MFNQKPTVHFTGTPTFHMVEITSPAIREEFKQYLDAEGCYEKATVYGLNHPILGRAIIHTSIVVKKHDDGSFETLNTLYVPTKETDESK